MDVLSLPDSLILKIFSFLGLRDLCLSAKPVCRKWNNIGKDTSLWRHLDLQVVSNTLTDDNFLNILSQVSDFVETICLCSCKNLTDTAFLHNDIHCHSLKGLDVSYTKISFLAFKNLTEKYKTLEYLYCTMCVQISHFGYMFTIPSLRHFRNPEIQDINGVISKVSKRVAQLQLETIDLSKCDHELSDNSLRILTSAPCLKVHRLSISECYTLSDEILQETFVKLRSLVDLDLRRTAANNDVFKTIASHCRMLRRIVLAECKYVNDVGIGVLVKNCHELRHLVISDHSSVYGGNVTDGGMSDIGEYATNLRTLKIAFCCNVTDEGIRHVVSKCSQLACLDVSHCLTLTDTAMLHMSKHSSNLQVLHALGCVQFTGIYFDELMAHCSRLTEILLANGHYLGNLNLIHKPSIECAELGPAGQRCAIYAEDRHSQECFDIHCQRFNDLIKSGNSSSIDDRQPSCDRRLSCDGQLSCDNDMKLMLCRHVYHLSVLDLSFCSKLSHRCMVHIAYHCPLLSQLCLRGCCQLQDETISVVASSCKNLVHLDISGGSFLRQSPLTDASFTSIAENCMKLETLSAVKIPHLSITGVHVILLNCRALTTLVVTVGPNLPWEIVGQNVMKIRKRSNSNLTKPEYSTNTKFDCPFKFPSLLRR